MRINCLYFDHLCYEMHCKYFMTFRNLLSDFSEVKQTISALYDTFVAMLSDEEQLINLISRNESKQQLTAANDSIGLNIIRIRNIIVPKLNQSDTAAANAAKYIDKRLRIFMDMPRYTYKDEIVAIKLLLADLTDNKCADKIDILGLASCITDLQNAGMEFEQMFNICYTENYQNTLKLLRKKIDAAYLQMTSRINNMAATNKRSKCREFINTLNICIAKFNKRNVSANKTNDTNDDKVYTYAVAKKQAQSYCNLCRANK